MFLVLCKVSPKVPLNKHPLGSAGLGHGIISIPWGLLRRYPTHQDMAKSTMVWNIPKPTDMRVI
jgi:hypothetical protein